MATIIIETKKSDNVKYILDFLEKLGEEGEIVSDDFREDFLLGLAMNDEETGEIVSRDTIFSRLRNNS